MLSRYSTRREQFAMRSETIGEYRQVSQEPRGQSPVHERGLLNDSARYRPGILIFTRRHELLHADHRAMELIAHADQPHCEPSNEIHVAPVCELLNTIQAALDHRRAAGIWEPFELRRVIFEPRRKIVVRGLGLIDRNSHDDSRIVIALEEVRLRQEHSESQEQIIGLSQKRGGTAILGSAHPGSAHGVFDGSIDGAP